MIYSIVAYFWLKDMSPHLCYPPYSFTGAGGSRKPAAHNKDKLVVNPATGNLAQKSVINQQALHKAFRASHLGYVESHPSSSSSGTHSYGKWSKGLTDWQAFDEVTSGTSNGPHGKKPMAPEDIEEGDEDYNTGSEDDAEDEDEE
jgi:hypothetical protein